MKCSLCMRMLEKVRIIREPPRFPPVERLRACVVISFLTSSPLARYAETQVGSKINAVQKEIGMKKKVCSLWLHVLDSQLCLDRF